MKRIDIAAVWDEFERLAGAALADEDDTPGHIRAACAAGDAWLFAAEDCFLVVQHELRPGTRTMQLLVWLALSRGPHGCIARHLPFLAGLGRRLGVSRILFKTKRAGFARVMPDGWSIDHIVWSLEVDRVQG